MFGLLAGLVGPHQGRPLHAVRTLLGEELGRAVDVEGASGYAQDPTVSVPALVTEVAETYGLGEDAARSISSCSPCPTRRTAIAPAGPVGVRPG